MRVLHRGFLLIAVLSVTAGCADHHPARPDVAAQPRAPHPSGRQDFPAALAVAGGGGQAGTVGEALREPVVVRVTDAEGDPVPDVEVTFLPAEGAGSVYPATARTDTSGLARGTWTLGPAAGPQIVSAGVYGVAAVHLGAEAAPGRAVQIQIQPDSGTIRGLGAAITLHPVYLDRFGNRVPHSVADTPAWTSLDTAVATVAPAASYGRVTARAPGRARIVGSLGALADTAVVGVVRVPRVLVELQGPSTLMADSSVRATATVMDADGTVVPGAPVWWRSSNDYLARVDSPGLITGVNPGTVEIEARTPEGVTGMVEVTVPGVPFESESYSAGGATTCAVSGGKAYCWGANHTGQGGFGRADTALTPRAVTSALRFVSISTGIGPDPQGQEVPRAHTCAVAADRSAWCWGLGSSGQLGTGAIPQEQCRVSPTWTAACSRVPVRVAGDIAWEVVIPGATHTCGLSRAGVAYCWGANDRGQLGASASTTCPGEDAGAAVPCAPAPVPVAGVPAFLTITAGDGMTCARAGDQGWCWGATALPAPLAGFTINQISLRYRVTCIVRRTRRVACWTGLNQYVGVPESGTWLYQVSAGSHHACFQTGYRDVLCWGSNSDGQLGPTVRWASPPYDVGGFSTFEAGGRHTCGWSSGILACWGDNAYGQLGYGGTSDSPYTRIVVRSP